MIYDKSVTPEHWGKEISSINGVESMVMMEKKNKPDPNLTPYTKVNIMWVADLNVKGESVKPPEGNIKDYFVASGQAELS